MPDPGNKAVSASQIVAGANLRGVDLRWTNLREAHLTWADLRGSDLSGVDLSRVNLRGAHLSEANLSEANLRRADLSGVNLHGADLRWASLRGSDLSGSDLSRADLRWANLDRANLRRADLSGVNLHGADLGGADLTGAKGLPDVPVVADIDAVIVARVDGDGDGTLEMKAWHGADGHWCGTTHCIAGWAIHEAGEAGHELEVRLGPSAAGALIFAASRADGKVPDFYATNEQALADLRARITNQPEDINA